MLIGEVSNFDEHHIAVEGVPRTIKVCGQLLKPSCGSDVLFLEAIVYYLRALSRCQTNGQGA